MATKDSTVFPTFYCLALSICFFCAVLSYKMFRESSCSCHVNFSFSFMKCCQKNFTAPFSLTTCVSVEWQQCWCTANEELNTKSSLETSVEHTKTRIVRASKYCKICSNVRQKSLWLSSLHFNRSQHSLIPLAFLFSSQKSREQETNNA